MSSACAKRDGVSDATVSSIDAPPAGSGDSKSGGATPEATSRVAKRGPVSSVTVSVSTESRSSAAARRRPAPPSAGVSQPCAGAAAGVFCGGGAGRRRRRLGLLPLE